MNNSERAWRKVQILKSRSQSLATATIGSFAVGVLFLIITEITINRDGSPFQNAGNDVTNAMVLSMMGPTFLVLGILLGICWVVAVSVAGLAEVHYFSSPSHTEQPLEAPKKRKRSLKTQ